LIDAQKEQIKVSEQEICDLLTRKEKLDEEKADRLIKLHAKHIYEEYLLRKEYQDFTVPYSAGVNYSYWLATLKESIQNKVIDKIVHMEDVNKHENSCKFHFKDWC